MLLISCHEFMYPPDPNGVKEWGGYDPPAPMGVPHMGTPTKAL